MSFRSACFVLKTPIDVDIIFIDEISFKCEYYFDFFVKEEVSYLHLSWFICFWQRPLISRLVTHHVLDQDHTMVSIEWSSVRHCSFFQIAGPRLSNSVFGTFSRMFFPKSNAISAHFSRVLGDPQHTPNRLQYVFMLANSAPSFQSWL